MDQLPMLPPMLAIQQFVWTARIHHATSHRYPSHRGELWQFLHGVKTVKDLKDLEILCRYLKTYKVLKTYQKNLELCRLHQYFGSSEFQNHLEVKSSKAQNLKI